MPIIPMLPANEVRKVLAFLVRRLFFERESAVKKLIEVLSFLRSAFAAFFAAFLSSFSFASGSGQVNGSLSSTISPSRSLMILEE